MSVPIAKKVMSFDNCKPSWIIQFPHTIEYEDYDVKILDIKRRPPNSTIYCAFPFIAHMLFLFGHNTIDEKAILTKDQAISRTSLMAVIEELAEEYMDDIENGEREEGYFNE